MSTEPDRSPEPRNPSKAALLALAVASGEPLLKAARRLEVGERTAKRWNRSPKFRAKVEELRTALVSETVGRLAGEGAAAVDELARLMQKSSNDTVRLGAARCILDKLPLLHEHFDLNERIKILESRTEGTRSREGR